jgi:hypothetical protein
MEFFHNKISINVHRLRFSLYSGTCLIQHSKGPGKCVRLYKMSEYSGFILVNINTFGASIFVGKLVCRIAQVPLYMYISKHYRNKFQSMSENYLFEVFH